ncbi:hypothetical protein [Mesorhizobium sp. M6A.T.Ce.TU.016.01.1.1]|uniref:hypothetical protein n=1 Tax=Mesorhizobium sp. M6A.T.Ce.TU.016.01.1.1 TaxID=2496783 RepID=UPI000FCCDF2C|nr:hypothetical protein [Mesorhizobium sp. M6A.T.Ce.TU.016.01.1.1]RUU26013.1 hypothetical protein EOC94_28900 [Mesorhizobium sp. M6A.T.Ce.TU.016.01.1.1]
MTVWTDIPDDVVSWFREVFANANSRVTERLLNVPNIRETSLDDGLVEAIIPFTPPRLLPSNAVVQMHVHNIGGLRRYGKWETADIAVVVYVYHVGKMIGQKIGFLQSKRLFPHNKEVDYDDPITFDYGLNGLLHKDPRSPIGKLNRRFEFNRLSRYGSLEAESEQTESIELLNAEFGDSVYYLFYNPPTLPSTTIYPVTAFQQVSNPPLGCRVFSAKEINAVLARLKRGVAPTFRMIDGAGTHSNWRLEEWAADLLLRCKVGQEFTRGREEIMGRLIERRSGPIGAVISASIALPSKG